MPILTGRQKSGHSLILEGGFDEEGNFIHIPILDLTEMKECFRKLGINHFRDTARITDKTVRNLLSWKHSGFNINNSILIMADAFQDIHVLRLHLDILSNGA